MHDRVKDLRVKFQEFCEALDVSEILMEWVLESALFATGEALAPVALLRVPKYPTLEVFRLDHEYPINRKDDVIDLRCSVARRNNDVAKTAINLFVQVKPHADRSQPLPSGLTHLISSISTRLFEFRLEKLCAIFERQSQRTQ